MQGRDLDDEIDASLRQRVAEARMLLQMLSEDLDIGLGAQDVLPSLIVTSLGEIREGPNAEILDQPILAHPSSDLGL
jgi:hypothetical protein